MSIPGFSAEASLYKAKESYGSTATFEDLLFSPQVRPQLGRETRRPTGPTGPIGFPGQECSGACEHICALTGSMRGWVFDRCMDNCLKTCSAPAFL